MVKLLRGRDWTKYTTLIRERVSPSNGSRICLHAYSSDYYTLDCVYYEQKDTKHFPVESTYVCYLAVALEHQNFPASSRAEMNKLQLFNSPLKVLVTYGRPSEWRDQLLNIIPRLSAMRTCSETLGR